MNELLNEQELADGIWDSVVSEGRKRTSEIINQLNREFKDAELAAGCYTHDYGDD